jgi:riboflavin kinase / FMN adenylyltransferase
MRVFHQLDELPGDFGPTVVSVGNFDGVHRAHQSVLKEMVARAKSTGAKSVAVTFDPHPARILRPESAPRLITPLAEKIKLLGTTGLEGLLVLPFNRDLSLMTPRDFAGKILTQRLRAREVYEGFNFHFGHKAEGNIERLTELGKELGFAVKAYDEMRLRGHAVSSSSIRRLLAAGKVEQARHLLGRVFSIASTPGRGRGYGHKYTVPTINLARYDELIPGNGVYITRTRVGAETFNSVTNIGNRPTFGEDSFAIESHILNFHPIDVMADTPIEITFLKYLRPEMKWPDVDALRAQIAKDVHRARRYFHLCSVL